MTKLVISERFGGFSLSEAGVRRLRELGWEGDECDERYVPRDDERLVRVVEELGAEASGRFADLAVVEIPDDVKWHIHEYDGYESVHEDHRAWGSGGPEKCS